MLLQLPILFCYFLSVYMTTQIDGSEFVFDINFSYILVIVELSDYMDCSYICFISDIKRW